MGNLSRSWGFLLLLLFIFVSVTVFQVTGATIAKGISAQKFNSLWKQSEIQKVMGAALETEPERLSPKVSLYLLDSPENRRVCCGKTQKQDYGQFTPSSLQQHTRLWAALNIHPDVVCTCETGVLSSHTHTHTPNGLIAAAPALLFWHLGTRGHTWEAATPPHPAQPLHQAPLHSPTPVSVWPLEAL